MKAKDFVLLHYPNAKLVTIFKAQGFYYIILNNRSSEYFAKSNTESNAWVNAKKRIIAELNPKQPA